MMDRQKFINDIKNVFLAGYPENMNDNDRYKVTLFIDNFSTSLANIIDEYIKSATIQVDAGIAVGTANVPDKMITTSKGNGRIF